MLFQLPAWMDGARRDNDCGGAARLAASRPGGPMQPFADLVRGVG